MSIDLVKIRATISIGNSLSISTPFIQSFNVRKSRGQLSSFDASLKVRHEEISSGNIGGSVVIRAGSSGDQTTIYTGILKKSTVSPCWDDPGYVFLNISGTDVLSLLQGKNYTRRCRSTKSTWVSITGVSRHGLRSGRFDPEIGTLRYNGGEPFSGKEKTTSSNLNGRPASPVFQSSGDSAILVNITRAINGAQSV